MGSREKFKGSEVGGVFFVPCRVTISCFFVGVHVGRRVALES